ncbi:hypothetical protein D5018_19665 [Parashewanella curva]|uniref:Large polyvalent protein-associated domain-containing protein n=1 Tax=Parashewanella curva TaxID=2338552 RepID=A0A3L8PT34_9GAMM|nr:LPD7 domain-containing protein [Parashewanella curva]RLV57979.1 hypothetical protein D5018_19665 [Parashewanella curva]
MSQDETKQPDKPKPLNSIELLTKSGNEKEALPTQLKAANSEISQSLKSVDNYLTPSSDAPNQLPLGINKRYFSIQNKYYFRHQPQQLAFTDKGIKLQTRHQSNKVVTDLMSIAVSRNWSEIRVTGTQAFKREAWFQAKSLGLSVKGYRPNQQDLQRLAQIQPTKTEQKNQAKTSPANDKQTALFTPQTKERFINKVKQWLSTHKVKHQPTTESKPPSSKPTSSKTIKSKVQEQQHELER